MNLERGLRRVVLTVSFAAIGAGLAVTTYDTYETVRYVSATKEFVACSKEAKSWTPTMEDLKPLPDMWEEAARQFKLERKQGGCGYILVAAPAHLDRLWFPSWAANSMTSESYTLAVLPIIWGVFVSAGLGAIPWGIFHLVRWIVQGFSD